MKSIRDKWLMALTLSTATLLTTGIILLSWYSKPPSPYPDGFIPSPGWCCAGLQDKASQYDQNVAARYNAEVVWERYGEFENAVQEAGQRRNWLVHQPDSQRLRELNGVAHLRLTVTADQLTEVEALAADPAGWLTTALEAPAATRASEPGEPVNAVIVTEESSCLGKTNELIGIWMMIIGMITGIGMLTRANGNHEKRRGRTSAATTHPAPENGK